MKKQILILALVAGVLVLWQLGVLETVVLGCAFVTGGLALLALATRAPSGRDAVGRALHWLGRRVAP